MAHHWTPMSQVVRSPVADSWLVMDGAKKIAIIRIVELGNPPEKLFRAVTYDADSSERILLAYTHKLSLAAAVVWREWSAVHPATSNRR
jgi:hypothetical protein